MKSIFTYPVLIALIGLIGAGCAYQGVGLPNHPYQWAIAAWLLILLYHQKKLRWSRNPLGVGLLVINYFCLALELKLIIGGGIHTPLSWLRIPGLNFAKDPEHWLLSSPQLNWSPNWLSTWHWDMTATQTFLLVLTGIGAVFRFQPFTSFLALFMIILSIPTLISFNWPWVFTSLLFVSTAFYFQLPQKEEVKSAA